MSSSSSPPPHVSTLIPETPPRYLPDRSTQQAYLNTLLRAAAHNQQSNDTQNRKLVSPYMSNAFHHNQTSDSRTNNQTERQKPTETQHERQQRLFEELKYRSSTTAESKDQKKHYDQINNAKKAKQSHTKQNGRSEDYPFQLISSSPRLILESSPKRVSHTSSSSPKIIPRKGSKCTSPVTRRAQSPIVVSESSSNPIIPVSPIPPLARKIKTAPPIPIVVKAIPVPVIDTTRRKRNTIVESPSPSPPPVSATSNKPETGPARKRPREEPPTIILSPEDQIGLTDAEAQLHALMTRSEEELADLLSTTLPLPSPLPAKLHNKAMSICDALSVIEWLTFAPELSSIPTDEIPQDRGLKHYQVEGVAWLAGLHKCSAGGAILADEMGLGKSAQVTVFLEKLAQQGKKSCVIVPASTISNWERELAKWSPYLTFALYYGSQAERVEQRAELSENPDIDVIVTTYSLASNKDDRAYLRRCAFDTLVLDEGHMVKNMASARFKQLIGLKCKFRVLLTGTPLQNTLRELMSLLTFIKPDIFLQPPPAHLPLFEKHETVLDLLSPFFQSATSEKSFLSQMRIGKAQSLIEPYILRRRKIDVRKDLPPKIHEVVWCTMSDVQTIGYHGVNWDGQNGTVQNVMMELRKWADHPLLVRRLYNQAQCYAMSRDILREVEHCDANPDIVLEDMLIMSDMELDRICRKNKSLHKYRLKESCWMEAGKVDALIKVLLECKKRGDRVLLFSQFTMMLDVMEGILDNLRYTWLRMDGQTKVTERQALIDEYQNENGPFIFMLSTKAGGFGINLTAASAVIMYDLDFNPHNDVQAEDRAHRVGQLRPVTVYKFVTRASVEEHIYKLNSRKLKLDARMRGTSEDDDPDGDLSAQPAEKDTTLMEVLRSSLREMHGPPASASQTEVIE